ncbi:phage baseplate protein [Yinghuangia soli]|uniref:P68 RBP/TagC-like beta-propeller domain-containing protein n=1 Tax=Yinghuangia soli TaxID=2908204 RepID=A0AA41PWZ6_9ACTN|nr:hypothetical protein [Yinghuangia soli]MCF2527268.1 hypothetical protein [Yinghuangia soli]
MLRSAAAAASALAVAACSGPGRAGAPEPQSTLLPDSPRFDLDAAPGTLFREQPLAGTDTIMQSFAFDDAGQRLYAVQVLDRASGDLTVSRLTWDGRLDGAMELRGFGHGTQIGAERADDGELYLWVESHAVASDVPGASAWGTRITRLRFADGDAVDSGAEREGDRSFDLVPGAGSVSCATDLAHGQLALRFHRDGLMWFRVYGLADLVHGHGSVRCEIPEPPLHVSEANPRPSPQGFALYGRYLYTLEGDAYGSAGSEPPVGNTYITCTDLGVPGGRKVADTLVAASAHLRHREPEGLAIQRSGGPMMTGRARLAVGFASYSGPADRPVRLASVHTFPTRAGAP